MTLYMFRFTGEKKKKNEKKVVIANLKSRFPLVLLEKDCKICIILQEEKIEKKECHC